MLQNRFSMVAVFVLSAAVGRRGAAPAVGAGGKGIIPQGQQARLLSGVGHALGEQGRHRVRYPVGVGAAEQDQRAVHEGKSPQKGLFSFSSPMLVAGP